MNLSQFESATPGNLLQDQYVLYEYLINLLNTVKAEHNLDFSEIHLTGYSMGGLQAVFLADLDAKLKQIGFKKVLAINPPVGLFTASQKLDEILPFWIDRAPPYKEQLLSKVYQLVYSIKDNIHESGLNSEELEEVLKSVPFTKEEVKSLIAYSFTETLGNTIFASELVRKRGIVKIDPSHYSPQPWLRMAKTMNFETYFEKFLFPDMKKNYPDLTLEELKYLNSLLSKKDFLKMSPNVGVFHNQNDIILTEEEVKFLKDAIPRERLKIYPLGGHLGNVWYAQNVKDFLLYFKN
jgi:pimeloyl-ACP methyl ester carboxylesterase